MGALEKLFGSSARVKIIRLFFLNPATIFTPQEVAERTHVNGRAVQKELRVFLDVRFIKQASSRRVSGYILNPAFPLREELKGLVFSAAPLSRQDLEERLKRLGRVKLVVLAGIFIKHDDSRVDMLIVGDNIKKGNLERVIKTVEADVGRELSYAYMAIKEFTYRYGMYDKFLRDVFDYPHELLIDKIGLR